MAKTRRQREKSKMNFTSVKDWVDKQDSGWAPTAFVVPEGMQIYKWQKGSNTLDIIPFRVGKYNPRADEGSIHWERTYFVHSLPTVDGEQKFSCLKNFGKRCPICVEVAKMYRKVRNEDEKKEVNKLSAKQRHLIYVINRRDKKAGVQLLETAHWKSFGETLKDVLDAAPDDSPILDFYHPESGLTLEIHAKEDSFNGRKFNKPSVIQFMPRKTQYNNDIVDEVPCLDEVPKELTEKELMKAFLQEDDEKPTKKKRKKEEDDEDDDTVDEEEENEVDEEENEEVDEDVEDDEEEADEDGETEDDDDEVGEDDVEDDDADSGDGGGVTVGDVVTFMKKKKVLKGKVTKVNNKTGIALVKVKGLDMPEAVDLDELTKEDDEPKPKKKPKKKRRMEEEDEEDSEGEMAEDSDDTDEEEEDDEPVKPKKKRKVVDEDDEDDIPFDDDDDEPVKPKKKRR